MIHCVVAVTVIDELIGQILHGDERIPVNPLSREPIGARSSERDASKIERLPGGNGEHVAHPRVIVHAKGTARVPGHIVGPAGARELVSIRVRGRKDLETPVRVDPHDHDVRVIVRAEVHLGVVPVAEQIVATEPEPNVRLALDRPLLLPDERQGGEPHHRIGRRGSV